MKNAGYIRLYRYIALEYKKNLTDPEYRLLDIYACLVRWDRKNMEHFGTVAELSIRDIHRDHLPHWSVGKISQVITSLIKKSHLTRLPKKRMRVENFWIYQTKIQQIEQAIHLIEQGIQPSEQNIHLAEQKQRNELQTARDKIVENFSSFNKNVQPNEQSESG